MGKKKDKKRARKDEQRKLLLEGKISVNDIRRGADRYCVTAPDGSCISKDPRCMHNRMPWPTPEQNMKALAGLVLLSSAMVSKGDQAAIIRSMVR